VGCGAAFSEASGDGRDRFVVVDRLRGGYLDGCILDEYADMRPSVLGEVVRPMLADRIPRVGKRMGNPRPLDALAQATAAPGTSPMISPRWVLG